MLKINIFWAVFKKPLRMRRCFLFGPYFMPFFNGQFLKCDILPISNDPVLHLGNLDILFWIPWTLPIGLSLSYLIGCFLESHDRTKFKENQNSEARRSRSIFILCFFHLVKTFTYMFFAVGVPHKWELGACGC